MKRFDFALESVLEFRRLAAEAEERKLQALYAERSLIETARVELDYSERAERERIKAEDASNAERVSLDAYVRWVRLERARLANLLADCEARIAEQQAALVRARRDYELLLKLKQRRRAEWDKAFNKEIEEFAAEAYLARFNRG